MVFIFGYNSNLLLEKQIISIPEYYDGENPLIDEDDYRRHKGVNKIKITIYNDDSNDILTQFVNRYDSNGRLIVSNTYNEDLLLTGTFQIYYDYNQYIGYCEINIEIHNDKLDTEIALVPPKRQKYVIIIKLMESRGDNFVLAEKTITTQISDKFMKTGCCFDTKPTIKYKINVDIEIYDNDVVLDKSEIVSNVLAESFSNALALDKE